MALIAFGFAVLCAEVIESMSRPRRRFGRALNSLAFRLVIWLSFFGSYLAALGNIEVSAVLMVLTVAALTTGSNLKFRVLGEPLVFSDLTILVAAFRFPRLYLFAVPRVARAAILLGILATILCVVFGFVADWRLHFGGLIVGAGGVIVMQVGFRSSLMRKPDLLNDVRHHGVALTVVFYWQRWFSIRRQPIGPAVDQIFASADLIVIVQNESFCDPQALVAGGAALPGLQAARESAWAWGNLAVDCFGAYTMRTEYAVLCGVDETRLGFRRYDPFLTAAGQADHALPSRLPGHRGVFLHPYDLRFFGREDVMRHLRFDEIVGAAGMPAAVAQAGPYVSDHVLAAKIIAHIDDPAPSLVYAVTMENHGPWSDGRIAGQPGGWPGYLHHLRNGDAMLESLVAALRESRRDAVLVFFGDHRPSIPGIVEDSAARYTPYVILRINNGNFQVGPGRLDLTPSELHHTILVAASAHAEAPAWRESAHS